MKIEDKIVQWLSPSKDYLAFISHKRAETNQNDTFLRITELLANEIEIFVDLGEIEPGQRFEEIISNGLKKSQFLLLAIGSDWVDLINNNVDNGVDDYVIREIFEARANGLKIIPMCVNPNIKYDKLSFPKVISFLAEIQAHFIRPGNDLKGDVDKLLKIVRREERKIIWRKLIKMTLLLVFLSLSVLISGLIYWNLKLKNKVDADKYEILALDQSNNPSERLRLLSLSQEKNPTDRKALLINKTYRENLISSSSYHIDPIYASTISNDGRYIATAHQDGAHYQMHRYEFDRVKGIFQDREEMNSALGSEISSIVFSKDADFLLVGGMDRYIHKWKLNNDSFPNQRLKHQINKMACNRDGSTAAVNFLNSPTLQILNISDTSYQVLHEIEIDDRVTVMDFTLDDQKLVLGLDNNTVITVDLKTDSIDTLASLNATPTSLYVDTYEEWIAIGAENGVIHIYQRFKEGIKLTNIFELTDAVTSVRFDPDHQLIIAGDVAGQCAIWRLSDSELIYALQGLTAPVLSTSFSLDGKYAITIDGSNTMRSWKISSVSPQWQRSITLPVSGVAITGDSNEYQSLVVLDDIFSRSALVINPYTQEMKNFNLPLGPKITVLEEHWPCLFLGDASGQISIWNQTDTSQLITFKQHTEALLSLVASQSGDKLFSLGQDRRLLTWNVSSQQIIDSFSAMENLSDFALDFVGNQLLSISFSGKLRKHDRENLARHKTMTEIQSECTEIYIYDSGRRILIRDKEDQFYVFDSDGKSVRNFSIEEKPIAIACHYFTDNFVVATSDGKIMIANADGYFYHRILMPQRSIAQSVDMTGEWIVTAAGDQVAWWLNDRAEVQ